MKRIGLYVLCLVIGVICAGCATGSDRTMTLLSGDVSYEPVAALTPEEWNAELGAISAVASNMAVTCGRLNEWKLRRSGKKGFTSHDTEEIASLMFRFCVGRDMLWSKITKFRNADVRRSDDGETARSLLAAFVSAATLDRYSSQFVSMYVSDSKLAAKLNEGFYSYGVEQGSFDRLFYSVTSPENIAQLEAVSKLLAEYEQKDGSGVARVLSSEPRFRKCYEDGKSDYAAAKKNTESILSQKSLVIPTVANILRQNLLAHSVRETSAKVSKDLYLFQGWFFNSVSDIKSPGTPPIDFNPRQVAFIKSRLRPGDLLFTYTAGYMSNVFLPGKFKHGIVFVGLPEARRAVGLDAPEVADLPAERTKAVRSDIAYGVLPTGYDADVIEAVAEGVIFNSFDYLLKTHVNRMVVLRPRISDEARRKFLLKVFSLRGGMYDFDFDFEDSTYQCCTEVIYRALNGKDGIDFALVSRMGIKTLSADDIIAYHLASSERHFDVVVFAEENPDSPIHGARIFEGKKAAARLKKLMLEAEGDAVSQ